MSYRTYIHIHAIQYFVKGDIHPEDGIEAAHCIANKIASSSNAPSIVYSSPFLRTTHTASILVNTLRSKSSDVTIPLNIEEGLTEWQIPSLLLNQSTGIKTLPESASDLKKKFDCINANYKSVNPEVLEGTKDRNGAPCFLESEEDLLKRCKVTLDKLLEDSKGKSFAIVSHAPCDQALAYNCYTGSDVLRDEKTPIGPWPLGGITCFSRGLENGWELECYGDTDHMPGIYKHGVKHWSLPCLS